AGALPVLGEAGFATIELMDAGALRVAQRDPKATAELRGLHVQDHAALLIEHQEPTARALAARVTTSERILAGLPLVATAALTQDPLVRADLWHIRKGLFTAVAGARPSGTTALLEDIAVPVERLAQTCAGLLALFE